MRCSYCKYDNDRRAKVCGMCNSRLVKEGQGKLIAIGILVMALVMIVFAFVFIMNQDDSAPDDDRPRRRRPESRWGISMEMPDEWLCREF